ncbi:Fringe-like protein [Cooperia oncophora]
MNHELMFFVTRNASWSCHFDDDNYVNIGMLRRLLASMNSTLPLYLGKSSTHRPLKVSLLDGRKIPIWFATGGAGICLSQGILGHLRKYVVEHRFEALCDKYMLPDDVTLGLIITHLLKVPLTIIHEFHSHLEPLHRMQPSDIPSQISFGGSEQPFGLHGINFGQLTPSVRNDRLRFRALHAFLKSIR